MTVKAADRGPQVNGVVGMFLALSTVAIVLRCYCRAIVVKSFGLDDWFAIIAWVFFVFFCAFALTGVVHGTGQHASSLPPEEIPVGLKWWWACEPVYVLSNIALKLSISIFLLRIAISRTHRMIIYIVMAVSSVYGAFYFFLFVLQCRPSSYFWTRFTGGKGTCIDPKITVDATYAYSAISCVADWTLGIIPVFLVWNLQMNLRTKLSVAVILAVGAIASTATIIRIPYVQDLANQEDFLYATTNVALWSTSETGIGITASALATLRPLFRTFFSRSRLLGGSSTANHAYISQPYNASGPNGYANARSRNRGGIEELALTSAAAKGVGVTTVIESSGRPGMSGNINGGRDGSGKETAGPLDGVNGWGFGDRKVSGVSSDEEDNGWQGRTILKTTASSQVTTSGGL